MASITSAQTGLASATTTWVGGVVPVEGDKVTIALGHIVTLDGTFTWGDDTVVLTIGSSAVNVSGTLKASRLVSSSLTVKGLLLLNHSTWALDFGTFEDPIPEGVIAELVLNKATTPAYRNGIYQLNATGVGNYQKNTFVGSNIRERGVPLAATTLPGDPVITVTDADHGWVVGDELLFFTTTDDTTVNECEIRLIASISGADARTITLSSALTYIHKAGSPACNITCNVRLRPFNTGAAQTCGLNFAPPNAGNATLGHTLHMSNVRLSEFGTAATNTGSLLIGGNNPSSGLDNQFSRVVVYNSVSNGGSAIRDASARYPIFNECVIYSRGPVFYQSRAIILTNSWLACASLFSSGGDGSLVDKCWVTGIRDGLTLSTRGATRITNTIVSGTGTAMLDADGGVGFAEDCDLGYTYGYKRFYGSTGMTYAANNGFKVFDYLVKNCLIHSALNDALVRSILIDQGLFSAMRYVNRNRDPANQSVQDPRGIADRENAITYRSASSVALSPIKAGREHTRIAGVPCGAGKTVRVIGYVRMDAAFYNGGDFTAPTVTLAGLGGAAVTFTLPSAADTWHKFDLSITSAVAYDGELTLTYAATPKAVTTGKVYFDGVPDAPFVTKARHYGFMFDESSPARTVNPLTQASEEVAAAYTGVTVAPATPKITVGAGTANAWRKLYDHYQSWACNNIASDVLLTSVDGVNFTLPLMCKFEWPGMPSDGALSGGWLQLATPGVHSYSLSGSKIDFMTAGTYNLSDTKISGTVELVNSSGGAVVVQVAAGASYTNTGPNITVTAAVTALTLTGLPAGCDVVILAAGTSTILDQADQISGTTYSYQYTGTPMVDIGLIKPGYVPRYIRGLSLTTASASIPVSLDVDRNFA